MGEQDIFQQRTAACHIRVICPSHVIKRDFRLYPKYSLAQNEETSQIFGMNKMGYALARTVTQERQLSESSVLDLTKVQILSYFFSIYENRLMKLHAYVK